MTVGPDNNVWFVESGKNQIGTFSVGAAGSGPCIPSSTVLCIDDQPGDRRFKIEVTYQTSQGGGQAGDGKAIPLSSLGVAQGGLFWFSTATNPELLLKVLNACSFSSHYWFFGSAGTNQGVTIKVTDTKTGVVQMYVNPDLHPMDPIQDTSAFACQQ